MNEIKTTQFIQRQKKMGRETKNNVENQKITSKIVDFKPTT